MTNYFDNKTSFLEPKVTQYGSNMVMTNVNKPRKNKMVNIDTRFIEEYTFSKICLSQIDNYVLTLPERLTEMTSMKVSQIEIPMSFFNISIGLGNSTFSVKNLTNNIQVQMSITDGFYSTDNRINYQDLNTIPGLSFFESDGRFIVLNKTTSIYEIDFGSDKSRFKSKFGYLVGFERQQYILNPEDELISGAVINYNPIRYMYLVVDEFSSSFPNSFTSCFSDSMMSHKILAKITLNNYTKYGEVLTGNEYNAVLCSDKRIYYGKIDIQRLNIQLVNEWGLPIDLNGLDFSFLLNIEHE
jgi:hypothetical protein